MTNDKDLAVSAIGAFRETSASSSIIPGIPNGPPIKLTPSYLVKILPELGAKTKTYKMFIAIQEPTFQPSFVQVKGFFIESDEDDIISGYKEMVAAATQSQIVELWLPWHTVQSVRSLVFRTSKK